MAILTSCGQKCLQNYFFFLSSVFFQWFLDHGKTCLLLTKLNCYNSTVGVHTVIMLAIKAMCRKRPSCSYSLSILWWQRKTWCEESFKYRSSQTWSVSALRFRYFSAVLSFNHTSSFSTNATILFKQAL